MSHVYMGNPVTSDSHDAYLEQNKANVLGSLWKIPIAAAKQQECRNGICGLGPITNSK